MEVKSHLDFNWGFIGVPGDKHRSELEFQEGENGERMLRAIHTVYHTYYFAYVATKFYSACEGRMLLNYQCIKFQWVLEEKMLYFRSAVYFPETSSITKKCVV